MARVARRQPGLVDPGTLSAEPFRTLRLALQLRIESERGQAIVVTSPTAEDGKSTIAANYAVISAISGGSVLLIDGDLTRPTLHEFFGVSRSPGLVDLLAAGGSLDDYVHRVSRGGVVDLVPAGRSLLHSSDLASSPRMAEVLRQAGEKYDHVIIDTPPVLSAANAEALSSHHSASVLMVVRQGAKRRPLMNALRRLELVQANVVGLVLNRAGRLQTYGY